MRFNLPKFVLISILMMFYYLGMPPGSFSQEDNDNLMAPLKLSIAKTENYYVDLETLLNVAIENNIGLQIVQQQKRVAKLDVYTAYSELLPDVMPSFEQSRFQGSFQIFGNESFMIHRSTVNPKLVLDYTLFSGGENIYKILAAKRQHQATEYSFLNSKKRLLYDTANTYYDLKKAMKSLEIAKKEIDESEAILNLNKQRLKAGLGTILEVSQSEDQLALSKRKFINANTYILKTTQNLNKILNLPLELNIIPSDPEIKRNQLFTEVDMPVLLDRAIENREDLKEIKEIKRVYMAQRGIARSKFFPKLMFTTYWGGTGPRFHDIGEQRYIGYGVYLGFLKNLGVNYIANYKKSAPMLKEQDLKIQQKWRDIETEIADALLDYETADKQIIIAKTGLKAAEDSYKYASERLKAGVGTNIDVLSAQVRLTAARTNLLDSVIEYNKAQIALMHSIGLISVDKIIGKEPVISDKNQEDALQPDSESLGNKQ